MPHWMLVCLLAMVVQQPQDSGPEPSSRREPPREPFGSLFVGPRLAYFYYNELFPLRETLEFLGVDRLIGEPKSTEYGACEGLSFEYFHRFPGGVMFMRPKLRGYLGLAHTYDGSKQADTATIGGEFVAVYEPIEGRKNNYFASLACDIGGGRLAGKRGLAVWSGLDGRVWSRMLGGSTKERYYWLNVPLGVLGYVDANARTRIGFEASAAVFIAGNMRIDEGGGTSYETGPEYRPVRLGDSVSFGQRLSFSISLPIQVRSSPQLSVRLVPWFEWYRFEKSNVDSVYVIDYSTSPASEGYEYFFEPASRSCWWGLAVDFVIHRRIRR